LKQPRQAECPRRGGRRRTRDGAMAPDLIRLEGNELPPDTRLRTALGSLLLGAVCVRGLAPPGLVPIRRLALRTDLRLPPFISWNPLMPAALAAVSGNEKLHSSHTSLVYEGEERKSTKCV